MNIKNIFISHLDFSSLHQKISNFVFEKIFILFPDPWHKRRHFKRKLINQSFIQKIKLISDNKTSVVIATDNTIYQDLIRESFKKDEHFEKVVEKTNDRFLGIVDVIETKYYKKALNNNNESIFFVFNKK
jgi:tRNA (guanine-N7-)-methyltransferase